MADDVLGLLVRISVLPERIDEFVSTVQRTMIEPTQSVPGCIRYELWQDLDEPATFTIVEERESEDAQAAHLASDWLQPVIASLQTFSAAPFGMQRLWRA